MPKTKTKKKTTKKKTARACERMTTSEPLPAQHNGEMRGEGPERLDDLTVSALPRLIAKIRETHYVHESAIRMRGRITNQTGAYVRRALGFPGDGSKKDRARINGEAAKLVAAIWEDGPIPKKWKHVAEIVRPYVQANRVTKGVYDITIEKCEIAFAEYGGQLPAWEWAQTVKGLSVKWFGKIIGVTGDLCNYANPLKMRKRMGLAPFHGHATSTWKYEAMRKKLKLHALTAEEWTEASDRGRHLAVMHVIAESILAQQIRKLCDDATLPAVERWKANGPYGQVYIDRRTHCEGTHPEWDNQNRFRDARRVMMQRFCVDLWREWMARHTEGPREP